MSTSTDARGAGVTLAALVSLLAIPGVPVLLVLGLFVHHASGYHGLCGPYPTDIPAYPCSFAEYLANFANPFALAGFVALSVVAAFLTMSVLAVLWTIVGGAVWLARARREVA